jgi:glycerol dehydrogenase
MHAIFCAPSRYTQGPDATRSLGAELATLRLQGPVLVVTSRSPRARLEPTWHASLSAAGYAMHVHEVVGECTHAEIARIVAATAAGSGVIVGAGGGKVIDAARAAAMQLQRPFVSCPTIASTDAPCSAISVVYSEAGVVVEILVHPLNPVLVLVDSRVIAEAPVRLLVAGMGDALSTMFEARACMAANKPNTRGGAGTRSALALAELCYRTLLADGVAALAAARAHEVTPALERIIEANTLLSGLGFESAGLAAAHAVHNGLTVAPGTHDYLHGEKVAFGVLVQLQLEGADPALVHEVITFCRAVGLPTTLAGIGCADLSDALLQQIAARAVIAGESIHNEPFAVTADLVSAAIRAADAAGRGYT